MYIRSLGSLLTRRFRPRGIPRTRAQPQAWAQESSPAILSRATLGATAARPARSLHTLRDVAVASGTKLTAILGFVGMGGFLYFKKGADESDIVEVEEFTDKESTKQYDVTDESAIKERFEQWMKRYNRRYKTEDEKAMRYENFKISARWTDKYGDGKLDNFADWTTDEYKKHKCPRSCDALDKAGYMADNAWIAQKGGKNHNGVTSFDPENMELVMKQAEERHRQADKASGQRGN